ncbi:MAG: NTP transferase domain-containing protein [Christensenellaceae bacterium]|jgi:NDP-sugar pyrophosphorylase family protein|nr:NTP transferase domain-containing protein [Christensenellaceae bacterium]
MTLLIMAAGLGRRFGGIKQLEPVGKHGEIIIDFSIHDAIASGFDKVVFVIRREIEKDFRDIIFNRIRTQIKCEYVFQETPQDRERPYGTGHAILSARHAVHEPFCVINADDMYGRDAFQKIIGAELPAMVTYKLSNTLSDHGAVSRGICKLYDGKIIAIEERHGITQGNDEDVSMNFFGFTPDIFPMLQVQFERFLQSNTNPVAEFGISTAINELIQSGEIEMTAIRTSGEWIGMTYPQDKNIVLTKVEKLLQTGDYEDSFNRRVGVHRKPHLCRVAEKKL